MGIKGRRKRQREQAQKTLAQMEAEGLLDEETLARLEEEEMAAAAADAPPAEFLNAGPFKLPPGVSATTTKLKHSERFKMQDEEYLNSLREEHKNRKGSHLKMDGTKRARKEEAQREREAREVMAQEQLAENYNLGNIDALIGAKEGNTNRNQAASGPLVTNALLSLHETLVMALKAEGYHRLTKIQERSIPLVMQGYDILGQAKTGSGKTLAFVIPMLHSIIPILQNAQKNSNASTTRRFPLLGLILTPTKELSVQIHKVIEALTKHFNSSNSPSKVEVKAHLITGGTNINEERKHLLAGTNIVVGTPGRILDHVRNSKGWVLSTLKYLILDEADRMLADGFQRDLDSIIAHLPKASRQTFLFSATNSKSVRNLARLSLGHTPIIINTKSDAPEYVDPECPLPPMSYTEFDEDDEDNDEDDANDEDGDAAKKEDDLLKRGKDVEDIPSQLRQFCYIGKLEDRLRALYVFIKRTARKSKVMVFCSTVASTIFHCQMMGSVGFHNEVLMLHGHMKHRQRLQTFDAFNQWPTGVLFCTDVAARGLDIPNVDWILQYDPPLDPTEYIHRVGRTARAGSVGNALIFLSEEEAPFVTYLARFNITMERLPMPSKLPEIQEQLERVLQLDEVVAKSAVSAYRAHVGAYQTHLLQQVFNIQRLDLDNLATAFALTSAPQVSLPKNTADEKKKEYVAGKLKSLNRRKKEALKHFHQLKTKKMWTEDGQFVGVVKPDMTE